MGSQDTDQILVQRVKRGEKAAFDALVLRYQSRIVSLVSRFVRNPTDALDVTQEAFLKAYRALPGFRGESAFYTWMYRIAVNTAKNYLAAQVRRPQEMDSADPDLEQYEMEIGAVEVDTPEHLLLTEEIQNTVVAAIKALPEDLRTAISLRELEGLSYEEIAVAMDCPVGTVRSRIFRAREAIDRDLKPLLDN
jgi:RNA polymerase sigma-70 factor (ECF subfamily)